MMRFVKFVLAAGSVAGALTSVGCVAKDKFNALEQGHKRLVSANQDLQDQFARLQDRASQLQSQVESRDVQLASRDMRIQQLQQDLANCQARPKPQAPPAPPGPGPSGGGPKAPGWETMAAGDRITVGSDVLFPAGRATLSTSGQRALDQIARDLRTTYANHLVRVCGYTDSDPIVKTKKLWQDNLDLSANRAMAVTRYLVGKGIKADSIETVGMGATNFVAPNTTAAGKQKNRRVEIIAVRGR